MDYRYSVEVLRSGQPRPYADTEHEYKIYCERNQTWGKPEERGWKPFLPFSSGLSEIEKQGRIDQLIQSVTMKMFWRKDTQPNWSYPLLKWIKLDEKLGVIHVFITEEYTD